MLFAFFSSVFYTAPPIRYGWLGLGELLVGVNMGVIMTAGAAAALTGALTERAVLLSIPVALMVASILYYQSLSDIDDDRAVGKNTIAVRLGRERAIWGYRFFVFASTLSMVTLVIAGLVHPLALISLLTLIPAYRIDERIRAAQDWRDLHDKGAGVRLFYLANGITLICAVYFR
jgi:1,4-dihydroxy-2-naphthoate octaprenyltransferase